MNSLERYLATIDGRRWITSPHTDPHAIRRRIHRQPLRAFASDYRVLTEANLVCAASLASIR